MTKITIDEDILQHTNPALFDKTEDELEVSLEKLSKQKLSLSRQLKHIFIEASDVEKKQSTLENSQHKLKWIRASTQILEEGITKGQAVVDKYNELAFLKINELFKKYFSIMVPNKTAYLCKIGGTVTEGIEIMVVHNGSTTSDGEGNRPKVSSLSQLSGGEKTMLSLAFLFSLASFHKSMFYILDEVDAALDEEKQKLVARLITKMFDKQQVIMISHNSAFQNEARQIISI